MQMAGIRSEESLTTLDYLLFSKEVNTEPSRGCAVLPCVCQQLSSWHADSMDNFNSSNREDASAVEPEVILVTVKPKETTWSHLGQEPEGILLAVLSPTVVD